MSCGLNRSVWLISNGFKIFLCFGDHEKLKIDEDQLWNLCLKLRLVLSIMEAPGTWIDEDILKWSLDYRNEDAWYISI